MHWSLGVSLFWPSVIRHPGHRGNNFGHTNSMNCSRFPYSPSTRPHCFPLIATHRRNTAMLKDQPDNEMIWYGLVNEYIKLENWPAAIEAHRNVIRIKPDYTWAYQMLGSTLIKQEGLEGLVQTFVL